METVSTSIKAIGHPENSLGLRRVHPRMFEKLPVPTPFQVGAVNAYLAGTTLVDPGIDTDEAWEALQGMLDERGLMPGDVTQVIITHPHPDHFGIAAKFRERGAEVVASPRAAEVVEDFRGNFEREKDYFRELFTKHGMSPRTAETVVGLPEVFLDMAPSVEVTRRVDEGDSLEVTGRDVEVVEVVGHAPGELVYSYWEDDNRIGIVGDNVLQTITPAPFLQLPRGGERPHVLPRYNDSLERLREMDFDLMLPGHRMDVTDPGERIGEILGEHDERSREVLGIVGEEPRTACGVMEELFGDLPVTEYFPGMSEALGHLDVLMERGDVVREERDGMYVYGAADGV